MGMFDFIKDAGSRLFGRDDDEKEVVKSLSQHVREHGIDPGNLHMRLGGDGIATIKGYVSSQTEREKVVMIIGNVKHVSGVDDQMMVGAPVAVGDAGAGGGEVSAEGSAEIPAAGGDMESPDWESRTYTVESGDTLWKISKDMYGEGGKYMKIFEANKPMLSDPDKIYPGQVLLIPKLDD